MKRIISILLIISAILFCFTACSGNQSDDVSLSNKNSSSKTQNKELTLSELKKIAEEESVEEWYNILKRKYSSSCNMSATKYKVGNVTYSDGEFTVYITFNLYDNYGKLYKSIPVESTIELDEHGKTSLFTIKSSY